MVSSYLRRIKEEKTAKGYRVSSLPCSQRLTSTLLEFFETILKPFRSCFHSRYFQAICCDRYQVNGRFVLIPRVSPQSFVAYRSVRGVLKHAPLCREGDAVIEVGDGGKQTKEAWFMPVAKKLYQESEDVSKARFIFSPLWGAVSVLIGHADKIFCLPLLNLQDGVKTLLAGPAQRRFKKWAG